MEQLIKNSRRFLTVTSLSFLTVIALMSSCKKSDTTTTVVNAQSFTRVNLVSSTSLAGIVDANLVNGWGLSFSPTGTAWVSSQAKGVSVVYDQTGTQKLAPVIIPSASLPSGGAPTGQVFNTTTDFTIAGGSAAKFIFAGADGVISAWNSGAAAIKVVDRSATSAYLGITLATNASANYLYAADFRSGKIDVFDKNFTMVSMSFTDPSLPSGYSPFNIQNIGGLLYVMYARVDATSHEEQKGSGLGYVDVYNTDGSFVKRFASQGALNAPWGIAQAPSGFLTASSSAILIGNFGDGRINAFDMSGNFLGSLQSGGTIIQVDGLWGISFAPSSATTVNPNWLFFASGPSDESQGLFGYISN